MMMPAGADLEFHFRDLEFKRQKLMSAGRPIIDKDFVNLFIASLPESYDNFCQSIQWGIITINSLLQHV